MKARLAQPGNTAVGAVNPLGTALANLIGSAADVLTSWQQAIVALVFELCLVGVMVIYELLGHTKRMPANQEEVEPLATPGGQHQSISAETEASHCEACRRKRLALHQGERINGSRCQD